MKTWMMSGAAVCLWSGALWFFQDTLSEMTFDKEHMRNQIVKETMITIGREERCSATVSLSTWDDFNQIGIYAWTAACEDATQ